MLFSQQSLIPDEAHEQSLAASQRSLTKRTARSSRVAGSSNSYSISPGTRLTVTLRPCAQSSQLAATARFLARSSIASSIQRGAMVATSPRPWERFALATFSRRMWRRAASSFVRVLRLAGFQMPMQQSWPKGGLPTTTFFSPARDRHGGSSSWGTRRIFGWRRLPPTLSEAYRRACQPWPVDPTSS